MIKLLSDYASEDVIGWELSNDPVGSVEFPSERILEFNKTIVTLPFGDGADDPSPRKNFGAVKVDNRIIIVGGEGDVPLVHGITVLDDVWAYDLETELWEELGHLGMPVKNCYVIHSNTNRLTVFGGRKIDIITDLENDLMFNVDIDTFNVSSTPNTAFPINGAGIYHRPNETLIYGGLLVNEVPSTQAIRITKDNNIFFSTIPVSIQNAGVTFAAWDKIVSFNSGLEWGSYVEDGIIKSSNAKQFIDQYTWEENGIPTVVARSTIRSGRYREGVSVVDHDMLLGLVDGIWTPYNIDIREYNSANDSVYLSEGDTLYVIGGLDNISITSNSVANVSRVGTESNDQFSLVVDFDQLGVSTEEFANNFDRYRLEKNYSGPLDLENDPGLVHQTTELDWSYALTPKTGVLHNGRRITPDDVDNSSPLSLKRANTISDFSVL